MTKDPYLTRGTIALLASSVFQHAYGQDFVNWAVNALIDGFDCPSLEILASLDIYAIKNQVDPLEVKKYFMKVVEELALPLPEQWLNPPEPFDESLLRSYFNILVEQIREGTIDPVIGINRIHEDILDSLNHPADLMPWCYLWEGNTPECFPGDYSEESYPKEIIKLAKCWPIDADEK